ncbi:MAG: hypothetical protein WAV30_03300 [Microgenomates group bacterium]
MKRALDRCVAYVVDRKMILTFSLLFFLLRTLFLDKYFFLKDERDLVLTALSLAKTGKDLYGTTLPLVFDRISPQAPLLGMYWTVPILYLFNISSPLIGKLIYMLPSLFFPLLTFELIYSITKNRSLSQMSAFITSFSPWFYHVGRLGVEAHLAYFFCLLGLTLYIRKMKIVGVVLLLLSFLSYQGIRPFLFIVIPYCELAFYFMEKKRDFLKTVGTIAIFSAVILSTYFISTKIEQSAMRGKAEILLLNSEKLSNETDFLRSIAEAPFSMRQFFDNKVTIVTESLSHNFFKGIDFSYLFATGDYQEIYANNVTGQFFPFLVIFLILGIALLHRKNEFSYYVIAGFVIIGLISSLINSYSLTFSIRSMFSLIGIGFLCALGMEGLFVSLRKNHRWILMTVLVILYTLSSITFTYKYLFQNYKRISESFFEQERTAAETIARYPIKTVVASNIHSHLLSNIATKKAVTAEMFNVLHRELNKVDSYTINGITYQQCNTAEVHMVGGKFPLATIMEDECLDAESRSFLDLNKSGDLRKILSPTYKNEEVARATKYYYFR